MISRTLSSLFLTLASTLTIGPAQAIEPFWDIPRSADRRAPSDDVEERFGSRGEAGKTLSVPDGTGYQSPGYYRSYPSIDGYRKHYSYDGYYGSPQYYGYPKPYDQRNRDGYYDNGRPYNDICDSSRVSCYGQIPPGFEGRSPYLDQHLHTAAPGPFRMAAPISSTVTPRAAHADPA